MRIPAAREHVSIEGRPGMFLVLGVDQESQTIQLVPLIGGDEVLSVPFSSVQFPHGKNMDPESPVKG
jgi:hypothetical protein